MRKIIGFVLAVVMSLSLCACGSAESKRGEVVSAGSSTVEEVKEEVKEAVENAEEAVSAATEDLFEAGSNQNGEYKNSFLGIGCKLDENWNLYSDAQIEENNKATISLVDGDYAKAMETAFESGSAIMDMMASNVNGTDSINVTITSSGLQGALFDIETFANATAKSVEEPMAQLGVNNLSTETVDYPMAGKDGKAVVVRGTLSVPVDETTSIDVDMYEKVCLFKKGTYIASVTACSFFEDHTDEYLSMFYEVK